MATPPNQLTLRRPRRTRGRSPRTRSIATASSIAFPDAAVVRRLLRVCGEYLVAERGEIMENNIRLIHVGRHDRRLGDMVAATGLGRLHFPQLPERACFYRPC